MTGSSSTRSTGSGTASCRSRRHSLRLTLTLAFVTIAFASVVVAAVTAGLIATSRVNRYFSECQGAGHMYRQQGGPTSQGALRSLNQGFLIGSVVAILLGMAASLVLARTISRPLLQLTGAAEGIRDGDYSGRVEVKGGAEIEDLAASFNELAASLEENEMLRRNMVADIAHELRNPLASAMAHLEAIEDGVLEPDTDTLASIAEDVGVLSRLVDDLRQLAQVESGQVDLEVIPVDLAEAVRGAVSRFEQEAASKSVSLAVDADPDLRPVAADPVRLAQVLANLLKNALAHTPGGGSVSVRAAGSADAAMVRVTDTGTGIGPEDLPYIFERFYRAEPARERATGGAGIGLTVARSLVEAMGGTISAESEPGRGTTVSFTVPLQE